MNRSPKPPPSIALTAGAKRRRVEAMRLAPWERIGIGTLQRTGDVDQLVTASMSHPVLPRGELNPPSDWRPAPFAVFFSVPLAPLALFSPLSRRRTG